MDVTETHHGCNLETQSVYGKHTIGVTETHNGCIANTAAYPLLPKSKSKGKQSSWNQQEV